MLLKAEVKNDKFLATHIQKTGEIRDYCKDLAKDQSNGFTKDRSMRRVGSFPVLTLMEYDRLHPGWYSRAMVINDFHDRQKAWREFMNSDMAKPFLMVEKLKH